MIFFFDAEGNAIRTIPSRVKQGSNKASRVYCFMPTGVGNVVDVAFSLPNGETTPPIVMTPFSNETGLTNGENGVYDAKGNVYHGWFYDLEKAVTAYAGIMTAQFRVYTPPVDDEGVIVSGDEITTESVEITVVKGVAPQEATGISSYESLINLITSLNTNTEQYKGEITQQVNELSDKVESATTTALENGVGDGSVQLKNASNVTVGRKAVSLGEGLGAYGDNQVVVGTYNEQDNTAIFIVGSGVNGARANALVVSKDGTVKVLKSPINAEDATNKEYVDSVVNSKLSSVYKPKGTIPADALLATDPNTLDERFIGAVYNLTGEFTTNNYFLEGAGKKYPAGTNVAVVVDETNGLKKYDVLSGIVDLSAYATIAMLGEVNTRLLNELDKKQNVIKIIS